MTEHSVHIIKNAFTNNVTFTCKHDSLAERSKAVAQGAIPKGRGFEPHSCHSFSHCDCIVDARLFQNGLRKDEHPIGKNVSLPS